MLCLSGFELYSRSGAPDHCIYSKMLKALAHLIRCSKGNRENRSWRGEGRERLKKNINREKNISIQLFICLYI